MRDDVLTPTIEDGAVRRLAAWSCTTAKRTRGAARTAWTTWSSGVLPTICWRPSRTWPKPHGAQAREGAAEPRCAGRCRRASLRGKVPPSLAAREGATEPRCAGRCHRASLRGKDLTARAVAPDLTLRRSQRSEATGSVRNPRPLMIRISRQIASSSKRRQKSSAVVGSGIARAPSAQRVQEGGVVTTDLDVVQHLPAAQDVVGDVEHVVRVLVRARSSRRRAANRSSLATQLAAPAGGPRRRRRRAPRECARTSRRSDMVR